MATCKATLNIAGEHFNCDLDNSHEPLAHCSRSAHAIWLSHDEFMALEKKGIN